jgi:uncharacterized membrane protein YfcA
MQILVYLSIGLAVGLASGSLGIGGGVLLAPALIWLCQFESGRAAGTSLAVLMIPVCLPAAWQAWSQERVDLEAVAWIAAAFAVGGWFGGGLAPALPEASLRLALGGLLVVIGVQFVAGAAGTLAGLAALLAGLVGAVWLRSSPGRATADLDYHI